MPNDLISGLPAEVADTEYLARFIYQSNQFNLRAAKSVVFLPPSNYRLSVARQSADPLTELRHMAATYRTDKVAYGAAMIIVSLVRSQDLEVEADEPPIRHANIIGWPVHGDPDEQKSQQLQRAKALADASQLILF